METPRPKPSSLKQKQKTTKLNKLRDVLYWTLMLCSFFLIGASIFVPFYLTIPIALFGMTSFFWLATKWVFGDRE